MVCGQGGIIDDKDQVEPIKGFLKKVIQAIAGESPAPAPAVYPS